MAGGEIPEDLPTLTPLERLLVKYLSMAILDEIRERGGLMPQFCAAPGCGVLVSSGRCSRHTPRVRLAQPAYARVHRWYTSTRWLRLRAEVIQDQPLCRACLHQGYKTPTQEIDHIIKHDGQAERFWDRSNLQGLCTPCHTKKTRQGD